jgi:hypothetical protein
VGNPGATCRTAAGACDQAETCTGASTICPADLKRTGACRPVAGACDVAEHCDGVSNVCPADRFAAAATTCRAAAGACDVAETCTGTSATCPADAFVPDGTTCGGGACSSGDTCQGGVCSGQEPACGACETCDPVAGCITAPRPTCRRPVQSASAQLKLKNSLEGPAKDQLKWKWSKGAATAVADLGDPVTSDGLAVCVFDLSQATPSLLFRATVPPGGVCGTKPCWVGKGGKFKFTSKTGEPDGVTGLALTPGETGKARIQLKAKGLALTGRAFGLPAPPLPLPLAVQLQSENGQCWEAHYSVAGVKTNAGATFDATAD